MYIRTSGLLLDRHDRGAAVGFSDLPTLHNTFLLIKLHFDLVDYALLQRDATVRYAVPYTRQYHTVR